MSDFIQKQERIIEQKIWTDFLGVPFSGLFKFAVFLGRVFPWLLELRFPLKRNFLKLPEYGISLVDFLLSKILPKFGECKTEENKVEYVDLTSENIEEKINSDSPLFIQAVSNKVKQ